MGKEAVYMGSKWLGKALSSFIGTAVLALGVGVVSPLTVGALASQQDEFVTQDDLTALKEEVKTLRDELKTIKVAKPEVAPAITGNVYSELSRKIKLGGEIRTRFEGLMNFDFTGKPNDTFSSSQGSFRDITLLRTRLNLDADVNDYLRAFLELQDNRAFGDEDDGDKNSRNSGTSPSPAALQRGTTGNLARVDLLQGYVELTSLSPVSSTLSDLSVLIGRWRMKYGNEHLIGPLDWSNQGRAWDGGRIRWSNKSVGWVDAFVTQIDKDFVDLASSPRSTDRDEVFWGIYGHITSLKDYGIGEIEPYVLGRNNAESVGKLTVGLPGTDATKENRYTLGLRLAGEPALLPGLDYEVDRLAQVGGGEIIGTHYTIDSAYAFYAIAGYTLKNMPMTPRLGGGITYATGTSDNEFSKGELNTFDQLYPTGHKWLGYMDLVGWQNIIDYMVNLSAKPTKKWLVKADVHFFYLEEPSDAWYNAGGVAIAAWDGTGNKPNDQLGQEFDLVGKYSLFKNFDVELGYSHFFQGNFIENDNVTTTGTPAGSHFGGSDADWFYLQTTLKF